MSALRFWIGLVCSLLIPLASARAQTPVAPTLSLSEGDYVIRDFHFASGEILPTLRQHYYTLGRPRRDASGQVVNAVLLLHGTGSNGKKFLAPQFADILLRPGGLLDPAKYFLIMPDGVGHGKSSKPSDGLHMRFPKYDYDDMVVAEHALVKDGLHVEGLRLILGTSMGCMHAFLWGEMYPEFTRALMPLACQAEPLAGRNRLWRALAIQSIKDDPAWRGGDYASPPIEGVRAAAMLLALAGGTPLVLQKDLPTGAAADAYAAKLLEDAAAGPDANDTLYQLDASRHYNPAPGLSKITAAVTWINSADDFINPPELNTPERDVAQIHNGRFVLIPTSSRTHGHSSHTYAALWQDQLAELLARSGP